MTPDLAALAFRPCPMCPDGYIWDYQGPTAAMCPVCKGHAVVHLDGTPLTQTELSDRLHD